MLARTNTAKSTQLAYQCRVLDVPYEEMVYAFGVIPPEDERSAALIADVSRAARWGKTKGPTAAADIERAFGNLGTLLHMLHCDAGGAADGGLSDLGFRAMARKVCAQLTTTFEKKSSAKSAPASTKQAEPEQYIIFLGESAKGVFDSFFATLREQARLRRHFVTGADGKPPVLDFQAAVREVREVHLPFRLREATEQGATRRQEQSDSHKALLSRISLLEEQAKKADPSVVGKDKLGKDKTTRPTRWGSTKESDETAETDPAGASPGGAAKRQRPPASIPSFEADSITSLYVKEKDGKRNMPDGKFHAVECFEHLAGLQFPRVHSTQWPCTWFSLTGACRRDGTEQGCSQCNSRREAEKAGKSFSTLSQANWAKLKGACTPKTVSAMTGA